MHFYISTMSEDKKPENIKDRPTVNQDHLGQPYTIGKIIESLQIALRMLFKNDLFLLESGANERSVSHKLAEYLQGLFPDLNVDCEYNRKGIDKKKLDGIRDCSKQRKTDLVYPDIIIHKRNDDQGNLVVIEIKTISEDDKCDIEKLKLFTDPGSKYHYFLGVFIRFNKIKPADITYYQDGKKYGKENIF
jgi:hypothetical protein